MANDILNNLNEVFLHHFPGVNNGEKDIIKPDESRFHNQPEVTSPEFDIDSAKMILGYPTDTTGNELSDKLDRLLWEHYDIFKHIIIPHLKMSEDYTVIFPLIDLFDIANNERNTSMAIRGTTSKTELNAECISILASGVLDAIDKRFDFWELDMGDWWEDTIETRKYLKELSYPQDGTDYDHLDGYYAFNFLEKLDWEEDTKLTDKSIFIYRILCVLDLADNQDLRLLDAEPTNGVLRKTLAEFIRNKVKSYQNWINKKAKR